MGKLEQQEAERAKRDREAAPMHYAAVPMPKTAREEVEEAESAEALVLDEAAAKLRAAGCPAKDALTYVAAVVAVLKARDKACVEAVLGVAGGDAPEGNLLAKNEALEALRVMAIKIVQAPKPRFSAGCFLLATGIEYEGIRSEREWAERQGLSHTHANNEVRDWRNALHLPATSAAKSEAARNSYEKTNGRIKDDE